MSDPTANNPGPGASPDQQDAYARLRDVLGIYGLGSLAGWAWQEIVAGAGESQILEDLRQTAEYKARFPGLAIRQEKGLPAMSEADYINYENTARGMMRAAGLPPGFYDKPDDFAQLIGNDVSAVELKDRIDNGVGKMLAAPPEVRAAFAKLYGTAGDGNLAAYFLDPSKAAPVLDRQAQAATIAGYGSDYGVDLNRQLAETLAQRGITTDQAQAGFQKLHDLNPLFTDTINERQPLNEDTQGVAAVFGTDGDAELDVAKRLQERQAAMSGAGGAAAATTGLIGLGSARSA